MKKVIFTRHNVIIFLILLINLIFRIYKINFQSPWLDEIFTLNNASGSKSFLEIFEILKTDVHPPFYYYLVHVFFKIFGDSIIVARLISVFFGLAGLLAMYYLVIELLNNKRIGILALMLLTINHFHVYYSQEARMYTMLFFTTIMAFIFMIKFIKKPNIKSAILHAIFASLMIYTHFFALFTLFAQYIILLFFISKPYKVDSKKFFLLSGLSGIITLILYIPAIIILIKAANLKSVWIQIPERDVYTTFFKEFFGFAEISIYIIVFCISFYLVKVFNIKEQTSYHINPKKDKEIFSFFILFIWFVVALIIPYIISYVNLPIIVSRYYINIIPIIIIFASIGLFYIKSKIIKCILISTFMMFSLVDLVFVKKYYSQPNKSQFREASEFVKSNSKPNEIIYSSLSWYFNYFFNEPKIIDKPFSSVISEIKNDTTLLAPFWYINSHGNKFEISKENEQFFNDNYVVDKNFEGYDAWAKRFTPKKLMRNNVNIDKFKPFSKSNYGSKVKAWIEKFDILNDSIKIKGWSILEKIDSKKSDIYLVFLNKNQHKVFFTTIINRPDITATENCGIDYNNSGFDLKLLKKELNKGVYRLGIYIKNEKKEGLLITDKVIDIK